MTPSLKVCLRQVTKSYRARTAIQELNTEFDVGLHVVVGPNGSGKTTLLNLIAGVIHPEHGSVTVLGESVRAVTDRVALAPAEAPQISWLTGAAFLSFVASLYPRSRRDAAAQHALLQALGIAELGAMPFGEMSAGTQKKFVLAGVLVANPPVLLFDEPTAELDEGSAQRLVELLAEEARTKIVLIATHEPWRFQSIARGELRLPQAASA